MAVRSGVSPVAFGRARRTKKALLCRAFWEWRDPDSNRGHHDFQKAVSQHLKARKYLQNRHNRTCDCHVTIVRNMRAFSG